MRKSRALVLTAVAAVLLTACATTPSTGPMSFFITSAGSGFAVDIRLPLEEGVPLLAPVSAPTSTFAIGPAEAAAALK